MSLTAQSADTASVTACSDLTRAAGEPLGGTATQARVWIGVTDPGPYPRKAVPDALPTALADWLADAGKALRLQLIRRPALRTDPGEPVNGERIVFVAHADASPARLSHGIVHHLDELATWDAKALLRGTLPAGLEPLAAGDHIYLVCTNGRRDPCCARYGRQAVTALLHRHPGQVWETSHLGGHRFAPTVLRLPDGYLFGGPHATSEALVASRGRSALDPQAQVAELAALRALDAATPRSLKVKPLGDDRFEVVDGAASWSVRVAPAALDTRRPESCGADDEAVVALVATDLERMEIK